MSLSRVFVVNDKSYRLTVPPGATVGNDADRWMPTARDLLEASAGALPADLTPATAALKRTHGPDREAISYYGPIRVNLLQGSDFVTVPRRAVTTGE